MEWNIADTEDTLGQILDKAEKEGPQQLRRHGTRFLVIVEDVPEEENQLIRAFLDEPEFVDIGIESINAPVRDPEL